MTEQLITKSALGYDVIIWAVPPEIQPMTDEQLFHNIPTPPSWPPSACGVYVCVRMCACVGARPRGL